MSCFDRSHLREAVLLAVSVLPVACNSRQAKVQPSIEFTKVPPAGPGGASKLDFIEGRVIGAKPGQQIVLFAKAGSWWVQPFSNKPFTAIQQDSKWRNSTHLGTEYAALLVEPGYSPPKTVDVLPVVGGSVVALATVKGAGGSLLVPKRIHFSGYEWEVNQEPNDSGGTTHSYSASNAWTDSEGALHLRIIRHLGEWICAEVSLLGSLGYGSYVFTVRDISHLEPATVLGMFTWDDFEAGQNHREIDIEVSKWGDSASKNTQFAIQPYYVPANVFRFVSPAGALAHSFRWEPGKVSFKTAQGMRSRRTIVEHEFTSGVPSPGAESVHINLYVYGKARVPQQDEVEVVIEKFEYLP